MRDFLFSVASSCQNIITLVFSFASGILKERTKYRLIKPCGFRFPVAKQVQEVPAIFNRQVEIRPLEHFLGGFLLKWCLYGVEGVWI